MTQFENSKGYKVLFLDKHETPNWWRASECEECGADKLTSTYYVPVINEFFCLECYKRWRRNAPQKLAEQSEEENWRLNVLVDFYSLSSLYKPAATRQDTNLL